MGYGESNGHVTDDVTWPRKIKVVTQLYLGPNISKMAGDRGLFTMEQQIGNWVWGVAWSRGRWRRVIYKGQGRDPKVFWAHYIKWPIAPFPIRYPAPLKSFQRLWSHPTCWRYINKIIIIIIIITSKCQDRDPVVFRCKYLKTARDKWSV